MTQFKNTLELIEIAGELAASGATHGEVADELNVSRETASWLVRKSDAGSAAQEAGTPAASPKSPEYRPQDVHVDWSTVGENSARLTHLGRTMAEVLTDAAEADVTVGIERAGASVATVVSRELDTDLGSYAPAKHQWEEGDIEAFDGAFSQNFSPIAGRDCYVVDDTITSGTTMEETIEAIREEGGNPVACVVLVDKHGVDEIDTVPVYSLIRVVRVGDE